MITDWYMIVGLGNPGRKYENTRHNIGWLAIDVIARRYNLTYDETQFNAIFSRATIQERRVLLVKPQTFMNLSGDAAQRIVSYYNVDTEKILVVTDDMNIPFGKLRLRAKGSAGGQKGLAHIMNRLGTQEINRLRLGIDRPPGQMPASAWVLKKFEDDDKIIAAQMANRAADAIETWLASGIEKTMTHHNNITVDDDRVGVIKPNPDPSERIRRIKRIKWKGK